MKSQRSELNYLNPPLANPNYFCLANWEPKMGASTAWASSQITQSISHFSYKYPLSLCFFCTYSLLALLTSHYSFIGFPWNLFINCLPLQNHATNQPKLCLSLHCPSSFLSFYRFCLQQATQNTHKSPTLCQVSKRGSFPIPWWKCRGRKRNIWRCF